MKKTVTVTGSLVFPLKVGQRAVIRRGGDHIFTSLVVDIRTSTADYACFETMNSIYHVSLNAEPDKASLPFRTAFAA